MFARLVMLLLVVGTAAATPAAPEDSTSTPTPTPTSTPTPTPTPTSTPTPTARRHEPPPEEPSLLEEHLPAPLLRAGPRGLRWWQWLALPLAALLSLACGWLLGRLTRGVLGKLPSRAGPGQEGRLVRRLGPPIAAFWSIVVASALRPVLALDGAFDEVVGRGLKAAFFLTAFWATFRAIDSAFQVLAEAPSRHANPGLLGLLPLLRKVSKVAALALGAVAVLNELGFHVTSLLAGLGIGGLALALAAQKTVENLIGSLAIGMDQPFRVGDLVQVEGALGTVEAVGMRSTRIRTPDRTLVTIPNGKLADMRIESYAARDRYRLLTTLRLRYDTGAAQVRQLLGSIEALLAAHPSLGPEAPLVRLVELSESALVIEIQASLRAADWGQFSRERGELYLRFIELVEAAGASFAYPTRTVELSGRPGAGETPRR